MAAVLFVMLLFPSNALAFVNSDDNRPKDISRPKPPFDPTEAIDVRARPKNFPLNMSLAA